MDTYRYNTLVDGIFDITHFGHANSIRQAGELHGQPVVAGLHVDEEVEQHKFCRPVYSTEERLALMTSTRYCADSMVIPYIYNINDLIKWNIKYNAHGDEICESGAGIPLFAGIKEADRFRYFPRTEGICTTDILDAVLNLKKKPRPVPMPSHDKFALDLKEDVVYTDFVALLNVHERLHNKEQIAASTHVSMHSSNELADITASPNRVVYVEGAFDLFNIGHLRFLQAAKKCGDTLVVGVYANTTLTERKGPGHPMINQLHRGLTVLSHGLVDAIILRGPNPVIDDRFIRAVNASVICIGSECMVPPEVITSGPVDEEVEFDPVHPRKYTPSDNYYTYAQQTGLFRVVDSMCDVTTSDIVKRIFNVVDSYEARNVKKREQMIRQAAMHLEQKQLAAAEQTRG